MGQFVLKTYLINAWKTLSYAPEFQRTVTQSKTIFGTGIMYENVKIKNEIVLFFAMYIYFHGLCITWKSVVFHFFCSWKMCFQRANTLFVFKLLFWYWKLNRTNVYNTIVVFLHSIRLFTVLKILLFSQKWPLLWPLSLGQNVNACVRIDTELRWIINTWNV